MTDTPIHPVWSRIQVGDESRGLGFTPLVGYDPPGRVALSPKVQSCNWAVQGIVWSSSEAIIPWAVADTLRYRSGGVTVMTRFEYAPMV